MDAQPPTQEPNNIVHLYYKNHMSSAYKEDERAIKKIIKENVQPTDPEAELKLTIFYKNKRTSSLIMKNSCLPPNSHLQETSLIYQYSCNVGDCSHQNSRYIGSTITTLSKRLTFHLQDGAIRRHAIQHHGSAPTRQQLEANTTILEKEEDKKRLRMTEAVIINHR